MTRRGDQFWRGLVAGALGLALGGCAAPVEDKPAPDKPSDAGNQSSEGKSTGDKPVTQKPQPVPPLKASPPGQGKITVGDRPAEKFNVRAEDAPVRQLVMGLVADTPYSVVIDPGVQGQVTLNLRGTTVPEAMQALSRVYGYGVEKAGQRFLVRPADFQTRIFRVNQLNIERSGSSSMQVSGSSVRDASGDGGGGGDDVVGTEVKSESKGAFWQQLQQGLATIVGSSDPGAGEGAEGESASGAGGERKLVVHPEAGVVLVRAKPAQLQQVADYLEAIQGRSQRQVVIEAKVLEVRLNKSSQRGINWAAFSEVGSGEVATSQIAPGLANQGSNSSAIDPPNPETANAELLPQLQGVDPGGYFSAALALDNFSAMVSLLETQGDVNVLSSPRVATLNNKKAVIKVGTDEFFVTNVEVDTNNTDGNTQQTVNPELTPLFSGIALDVTPQISKSGMVTMHVHPAVTDINSQRKSIQLGQTQQLSFNVAQSSVRESDSVVRAQDGQIVVIGGLMKRTKKKNDTAVPGLSRLPLLGGLFRSDDDSSFKQELVILLRPKVIYGERPDPEQQEKLQRQWQDGLSVPEPNAGR